jgi:PhnB protein
MIISAVPKGYTTVTPYLVVKSPLALFQFLQHAFGAEEVRRSPLPNGGAFNIEVKIGDAMVMLVLARQDHDLRTSALYLYVASVDETYERAILAGGKSLLQPEDQFYGDRCAGIQDSEGNNWWIGQRIEDLTSDEIGERIKALG